MFATANQYGKLVTMNYVYDNYKLYVNPSICYTMYLKLECHMITHAVQVLQVYELQNVVINNMGLNTQRC